MEQRKFISYTIEDRIALVKINNPPMNALSKAVFIEIGDVFSEVNSNDSIKAVVFYGEGRAFIAGADINELKAIESEEQSLETTRIFHSVLNSIEEIRKPVIAAIDGYCLGGGLEFALACHIRIVGDKSQLGVPEIKLGVFPGAGGTQRLPRTVGKAKALEMILTGDFLSAEEALKFGLANKVVPNDEVLKEAIAIAKKIVSKGQLAVKAAMDVVIEGLKGELQKGLEIEAKAFAKLCMTEDMKEGMSAFLEKRQPKFKDR